MLLNRELTLVCQFCIINLKIEEGLAVPITSEAYFLVIGWQFGKQTFSDYNNYGLYHVLAHDHFLHLLLNFDIKNSDI